MDRIQFSIRIGWRAPLSSHGTRIIQAHAALSIWKTRESSAKAAESPEAFLALRRPSTLS